MLNQKLQLKLSQKLSPQQIQLMKLIQLSTLEFEEKIKNEIEENLKIIKLCVKHKNRLIFPSSSEVYGLCEDKYFDENTSNSISNPLIYS